MDVEGGGFADLVRRHPGVQTERSHRPVRAAEVEHPEVGHHPERVGEAECRIVGVHVVPADSADDVDLLAEHPLGMVADPVTGGMVDGVAGRTAHTEHLPLRLLQRAERRDVLIAKAVNLIGAHHHMAPSGASTTPSTIIRLTSSACGGTALTNSWVETTRSTDR